MLYKLYSVRVKFIKKGLYDVVEQQKISTKKVVCRQISRLTVLVILLSGFLYIMIFVLFFIIV